MARHTFRAVEDGAAGAATAAPRFACPIVRMRIFEGRGSAPHGCSRSHGSPRCRLLMILLLAVITEHLTTERILFYNLIGVTKCFFSA